MARSVLYDVAAAGKFIPDDLKTKALQGANANNISLQMAARNPDYYLPKNFDYDWNKYEKIAPRTAEALKDPVLMSIAGTKAAEFWGEQENNWKSITALKNGFKNVARSGYGAIALLADLGADKKDVDLTTESKVFSADTIGRLLYAVGGDKLKTIGTEAKRIGGSEIFKPEEVKAETAAGQFYYDLLQNAPQLASQVGVAISTGGWSAAAFMGSQIAGGQYLDLTEAGVSNDRARAAASLNAVAQSALEKVGLGKVMGAGARAAKIATMGGKAKEVFKTALTEGITEWIQEYPDAAAEIWAKNANLSTQEQILKFYQEFGEITKRGAYSGAIGAVFGGLGGSVSIAVDRNANRVMQEQAVRTAETMKNSKDVDITASKLVLNQTTEEKAYVDAETLFTYAQANPNLDVKDTFGIEVSELQAAAVRGEDIEMPMGTYCAAEAQNPGFFQAVSNNVAFEQGGYTEERARNKKALQSAYKKALENDEEFRTAVDTFRNELTEAGLNQKETGDVLAILTSRAMIANPDDPMQYFRDNPLSFKRVVSTPNGRYMQTKSANEKLLEDENNFSGIVDEYKAGTLNETKPYKVMTTPLAINLAGGKILPVTIDGGRINHIFEKHFDGMTPDLLKQLPRAFADPIMVLDSYSGRKVVVLDLKDAQGSTIIVPLDLDVSRDRYKVNAINSAYGKGGANGTNYNWFIEHNIKKGRVVYVNKEKTAKWLQSDSSDSAIKGTDLDGFLNNSIPDENALRKRREEMQGYYQTAFHGSPHKFEKFDLGSVGTGTGIQAHGWGLYFAFSKNTAKRYRDRLKGRRDTYTGEGSLVEVEIPENDVLLDENKSIEKQPPKVREIIKAELERIGGSANSGRSFYKELMFEMKRRGAENPARAASEHLNKLGIKGIKYVGMVDGESYVIFDDQAIKIINSYNQKVNNDKKGAITWDEEGKAIISLFEGADMSTVIHEAVGHYFIENLMREGALPNATEQMKKDRQTMLDYAGVTKDWDSLSQEEKTAAHERWAEAAETYMLEGKAPSKELQPVFNRFKKWLLAIYNAVFSDKRSKNAVPINDEVRQVFDRMLASEEQISEMERIDGYFSALPDVVLDTLSEPRKQMLRNFAAKAHDKAVQLLTKESLVNFNQERKDRIQKYREDVEPQVKEAIAKQPLYMASEQILDIASDLKTAKGVANRYLEGNFDESKMATFDMIAEANGFTSGDELAKTIMSEPSFNGAVNRHIDEMVQDAFPDIYKERGLAEEAARDAMYNDESGLLINTEAQLIEDKAQGLLKGQRDAETLRKLAVARRQTAKIQAQMDLQNRVKLKEALNTQKYITAERNAAAKAAVALENDDYSAAVRYKNVQAFNHACVVESVRLRNQYAKWQNYFRKQAKAKRETWGNERNFIQAAAIMERFGYKRKDYSDFEKTETLSDYLNDMDDLYDNVAVADWIMDENVSITNPRERMTASQLEDIVNALKNIKAIAKQEMSINALQKGATYAEFKAEAQDTLNKLKTIWKPQVGVAQQPTVMEKLKASLRSTDNLFEMMDDWQYGFFSKHFGAAIREAADNETRKVLEYEEKTAQAYREWLPDKAAEKAADYQEKYDELGTSVDKHVLVKMLMNLGNESSARVLCSTRPVGFESSALWVDGDIVQTKINLLDFLGRNLTEADIKYAQAKIDIAEMYWSEMEALETRWTGFSPKKVEASPVELTLSDGKTVVMRGGYFPLMRDGDTGSKHAGQEVISDTDPRQGRNIRTMSTRRGHLKERVKAKYPVNLKRGAEFNVAMDAIHDLCFREVMGDFRKIMNDQEMYTLIKEKLGLADFSAFKEYLERAANPQGTNSGSVGESWMGSVANWLRARTVNAAIMLNLKTAVQNLGNPLLYGNAVDGFGYSDVVAAVSNYSMNMQLAEGYKSAKEFVYSKAPWMKERSVLPDISLRDMKEMESLNPIEKKAVEFGTRLLVATDNLSAIPVWMQAYGKKIRAGASEAEAVDFANTVIRRTLGSSRVTEVAPLLRGGPMLKLFTTFQGFFNTQYNQWAREYNIFLKEKDIMRLTSFVGAKFVMFAFINLMLSAEDPFEEDKDEYQKISKELLTYPMSLAGPVGQVGNAIWSRALGMQTYGYRMTAVQGTIEQMERAAGKVQKVYQDKADYDELVEPTATFVGTALGVPAQLNKLFFNGYDILFNDMEPEVGDIFRRRPKKER
uniref:Crystallin beta/gamma motif-containing protein n=1 Tax=Podoviridae sp. ctW0z17 TaxID=2825254 RepID=A0A8S5UXF4_9CAUD|nr:MAG TPA: crystallin beta/gamma motif-containing protein [Podoviridae sp. ctW0z17]